MLYAALGDSITYGYCSTDPKKRYASRLVQWLGGKQQLDLFVHAHPGWTSTRLLQSVKNIPAEVWDETRLVTLVIGGNDLLRAIPHLLHGNPAAMIRVSERLYRNVNEIVDIVARPQMMIMLGTLYNPFPNSPVAQRYTNALNRAIECAADREQTILVDINAAFSSKAPDCIDGYRNGRMRDFRIVGNPIHPNDAGHDLIARVFHAAYRRAALSIPQRKTN